MITWVEQISGRLWAWIAHQPMTALTVLGVAMAVATVAVLLAQPDREA